MSIINATPLLAAAGGDYQISRSVRLRSSASAYFSKTLTTPTSRQKITFSFWAKVGSNSTYGDVRGYLFDASTSGSTIGAIYLNGGLSVWEYNAGTLFQIYESATRRDPSAWYHFVVVIDTTLATSTDRVQIWCNGVRSTVAGTQPSQNYNLTYLNTASAHNIGKTQYRTNAGDQYDGLFAEMNFIDGQALTPSSFGEYDSITGVWKPKKYAGTYGTNGFYLNFSDNSAATATTIGKDYSGNGNNWTPNNISVTAGATYDSMIDVPTPYADGGNGRGNYPVINPLDYVATNGSISNGNLTYTTNTTSSNNYNRMSMWFPSSGKWYAEFTATQVNIGGGIGYGEIGIEPLAAYLWWVYSSPFYQISNGTSYATIPTINSGDVIQVAIDIDNGKAWFGQNNTWLLSGNPATGTAMSNAISFTPGRSDIRLIIDGRTGSATNIVNANFGQRPFSYTPPSGFKALNTQNLPDPTIKKGNQYFDVALWTGNNTARSITTNGDGNSLQFNPDFIWGKSRGSASGHLLYDAVRGVDKSLATNNTAAEDTTAGQLTAFSASPYGFQLPTDTAGYLNYNSRTYVGWLWKKGATPGFDVVTYTGTGANRTVAHALGVAPSMLIFKPRNAADNWPVWHKSFAVDEYVYLNLTNAKTSLSTFMNSTLPNSSNISLGTWANTNSNTTTMVCYAFAEVSGFSKFGSYTGNGSADGPFVYCGFRPAFIMAKDASVTNSWVMYDLRRDPYNVSQNYLIPNSSGAEGVSTSLDITANGFKIRTTGPGALNTSGSTVIFAAFAENPFKYALAR